MRDVMKRSTLRWGAAAVFTVALAGLTGAAEAQVKKIAVLVPEQGTDYGWNQQGVDAARAVADKFGLEFVAGRRPRLRRHPPDPARACRRRRRPDDRPCQRLQHRGA